MKKVIAIIICLVILFTYPAKILAAQEPPKETELFAKAAVLMDGGSGRVLYSKNGSEALANASTTKILTCIIALENCDLEQITEVSVQAAKAPKVHLGAPAGQKFRMKDLIYAMMLESFNDCAVVIAEQVAGTTEHFSKMMNDYAKKIGCADTFFITPNGLDAQKDSRFHHTTAEDLARIMRYCAFQSPCRETFLEITRTASRTIQDESGNRSFYLANHNALLSQCAEVLSGKTGFTGKAGYCYVAALKKEGKAFTVALLGCGWPPHKTYKWADMRKLDQYAFDTYNWYDIFDREKTFPEVEVRRGVKGTTALTLNLPSEKQMFLMLLRADEKPDIRYEYPTELEAPVHEGQEVGQASYYINDEQVAAYPIYAAETVEKIDYGWCLRRCVTYFEREFQSMWQTWGV